MSLHPPFSDSESDAMSDDDSEPPAQVTSTLIDDPTARFHKESTTPTPSHVAYDREAKGIYIKHLSFGQQL
jgi:hypothetical protein